MSVGGALAWYLSTGATPPSEELPPSPAEEAGLVRRAEGGGAVGGLPRQGLGSAHPVPCPRFPPQQRFQDTSQYVCAELQALEQEQRQIDGRAAEVETQLRSLMESGGVGIWSPHPGTCHHVYPTLQLFLTLGGVGGDKAGVIVPIYSRAP